MLITEWIGTAAACCTTLAFVPQVLTIWRSRAARDSSRPRSLVGAAGGLGWFASGVVLGAWR
ncbi:MAG: SemiSWEET family sugar transporter, partial [Pseudomonadota bacterium]